MIRGILIAVLVLAVAGTGYWGYQEHQEKNAVLLNAENNYQRAFHNLTYQVNLLSDKIGTTIAMNSRHSLSPSLAEVWRITSEAHSSVSQLPLTLLPFNKTQEFLTNVGNFSYRTSVRDLDKEPLSKQETKTLKSLYKQSGEIKNELKNVQSIVLKHNLRWMDVEQALASGKENTDNIIIDGFKKVEKTVSGYDESNLGLTMPNQQAKDENFKNLSGKTISRQVAVKTAKNYLQMGGNAAIKVTESGKGSQFGFYSVSMKNNQTGQEASIDITKKGGHLIWFIKNRAVSKQSISLHDAAAKGIAFLKKSGFKNMEEYESSQYDNIGVFNYVTNLDGVRIYPESVKVKVALDNGEIIGVSAEEYLKSYQSRKLDKPAITIDQAQKKVNPNLKIMEKRQAVIVNDLNQEVLCYEFLGTLENETYRIFINAKNGKEEKVEKLNEAVSVNEDLL